MFPSLIRGKVVFPTLNFEQSPLTIKGKKSAPTLNLTPHFLVVLMSMEESINFEDGQVRSLLSKMSATANNRRFK